MKHYATLDNLTWQGTLFTTTGHGMRRRVQDYGVRRFLDVEMFRDVIVTQRELDRDSGIAEFIRALNHYREYDAFCWPRPRS